MRGLPQLCWYDLACLKAPHTHADLNGIVGGWVATHSIPADRISTGTFNEVQDHNKVSAGVLWPRKWSVVDGATRRCSWKFSRLSLMSWANRPQPKSSICTNTKLHSRAAWTRSVPLLFLMPHPHNCLCFQDRLNEIGVKPLVEMTDHITETFGPFDITPAPAMSDGLAEEDWRGAWTSDYELPEYMPRTDDVTGSSRLLKMARATVRSQGEPAPSHVMREVSPDFDAERRNKITKTLAWLHSRGELTLMPTRAVTDRGSSFSCRCLGSDRFQYRRGHGW